MVVKWHEVLFEDVEDRSTELKAQLIVLTLAEGKDSPLGVI